MIEFKIPGVPVGKARPRMSRSGHVYTPQKTKDAEALVQFYAQTHCPPVTGPVTLRMVFGMPIPKSYTKKQRTSIDAGILHPCKTPDIDNLIKLILDGLNGIAYVDDKQVIEISAVKYYADVPGTTVLITEW